MMTFTSMAGMFMDPIGRMVGLQLQIQESQIAMKRLSEIFDVKKEQEDKKQTIDTLKGNIKFDDVTFSYGTRAPVLKNISFNINKGERVAIVGESGSGKTTIAKLLLGLWKPNDGEIFLDDIKVTELDFESLRSKVAYVNQNVELFSGSVAENIKIINPNVSREDINIALRLADASFVNNLPAGIDTYLEEAGANLSGGERQRLALARSLSKDFDLLILDEATSNLDFVSEQRIYENILNSNFKGTIVFIAHRLSSIKYSDNILVMDKGKLVESGTHDELLNNNGVYKKLWNSQNTDIKLNKNKEITKNEEIVEGSEITYE
ncbi:MAG TPA: ATP-binding cassette domain-containing protein [Acholeplasma sp.]|nr:ATP-binding cassette domain-containing protein [Acholeplasma sp.]